MSSGNGIVKSGGTWGGLWSKKSGGRGNTKGGMAQIDTASLIKTMTAVLVAITYQRIKLEASLSALKD